MPSILRQLIKENLNKIIVNEAMMDGFSFETLTSLSSYKKRIDYCKQMLGQPIGNGSSRIVFQISDERVLKVAKNQKGIAQNEAEGEWGKQNYDVFPTLYNVDDNYIFLETEYVLPCKKEDFPHVLNISFEEFQDFIKCAYNSYARRPMYTNMSQERYVELLENNENLYSINTYLADYQLENVADLLRLANLGLVRRNGEERIVILDDGLTEEIFNTYYRKI